jgi:hypothetical protein
MKILIAQHFVIKFPNIKFHKKISIGSWVVSWVQREMDRLSELPWISSRVASTPEKVPANQMNGSVLYHLL